MAHLFDECHEDCKTCINLRLYDDRQASWYYCGRTGNAYDSNAILYANLGCSDVLTPIVALEFISICCHGLPKYVIDDIRKFINDFKVCR